MITGTCDPWHEMSPSVASLARIVAPDSSDLASRCRHMARVGVAIRQIWRVYVTTCQAGWWADSPDLASRGQGDARYIAQDLMRSCLAAWLHHNMVQSQLTRHRDRRGLRQI